TEPAGRTPDKVPTVSGPRAVRSVGPTRPEARPAPVTTYARLRRSRPSWEATSSTHPGASTMSASASWRVTRGKSVLDVPLIVWPAARYGSENRGTALGLALPN